MQNLIRVTFKEKQKKNFLKKPRSDIGVKMVLQNGKSAVCMLGISSAIFTH